MSLSVKWQLRIQFLAGHILAFVTVPLVFSAIRIAGYRMKHLGDIRRKIRTLQKKHRGPWIICANHLTMIDSVLIAYGMHPFYHYLFQYRLVPWNIPDKNNVNKIGAIALLCYLFKCIPVVRGGTREEVNQSMAKCSHVLEKGESLVIFPEGTRSKSGRVNPDNLQYSVGRLILSNPQCRVLCVYMRGKNQETASTLPEYKDSLSMYVAPFKPEIRFKGLKAYRDCSLQIIETLAGMEKKHFDSCRQ